MDAAQVPSDMLLEMLKTSSRHEILEAVAVNCSEPPRPGPLILKLVSPS